MHSKPYPYVMIRVYVDTEDFKRIRSGFTVEQVAPYILYMQPDEAAKALPDVDLSYPGNKYMSLKVEIVLHRGKDGG